MLLFGLTNECHGSFFKDFILQKYFLRMSNITILMYWLYKILW